MCLDMTWEYGIVLGTCSGIVLPPEDAEIWRLPPRRMREVLSEARKLWPYVVDTELLFSCPEHWEDGPQDYISRMVRAAGRIQQNPFASPTEVNMAHLIMQDSAGYVYVLQGGPYYKIGRTNDVDRRISQISPKMPFETKLIYVLATRDMYTLESELHKRFADRRANGEWFELEPEDVWYIKSLAEKT